MGDARKWGDAIKVVKRSRGRWTGRVATLGYAVAGTVLAIGLLRAVDAAAWDTTAQG
jgi:ABC-type Fe3+ transport system permease subunit